jgi:hypothetical protein
MTGRPGHAVAKLNLLLLAVLVACVFLAGCATSSIEVPKEVKVPVPVACIEPAARPVRPQLRTEPDLMLMDRGRRTLALFVEWLQQQLYIAELEAVVEGCSRLAR